MNTQDFMFTIENDMVIHLGHHPNNLNLIVLLPKTDKRSVATDVTLKKMVESRTKDLSTIQFLLDKYSGKNALNIRRMKIKVDLYSLETNIFLGTCLSTEILDSTSKIMAPWTCLTPLHYVAVPTAEEKLF